MAITDDLVEWWSCDEYRGNLVGSVGNYDCVDQNTVGATTGKLYNGRLFARASNEHFTLADNADVSLGNVPKTWAFWVKFNTLPGNMDIFAKWSTNEYLIRYETTVQSIQFFFKDSLNANKSIAGNVVLTTGTWYFVVVWIDPDADTINVQIDNQVSYATASHTLGSLNTTANLFIGSRDGATNSLDGVLDEVAIWTRVLTPEERTWLYNSGVGRSYIETQPVPTHSITTAAVPSNQQMPGGMAYYNASTSGMYWESVGADVDPDQVIDFAADDFDILVFCRTSAATTSNPYVFTIYRGSTYYITLIRPTNTAYGDGVNYYVFRWVVNGTTYVDVKVPASSFYTGCNRILVTRRGNTFTISAPDCFQESVMDETCLVSDSFTVSADPALWDVFSSQIHGQGSFTTKQRIAHWNGATDAYKFRGTIGPVIIAQGNLVNYTDKQRFLLSLDPQRFFSEHGYSPSQITAYGNICDSNGDPKLITEPTVPVNGDKLICPFSGREMIQVDTPVTDRYYPPYNPPEHHTTPGDLQTGSPGYLDVSEAYDLGNGTIAAYGVSYDSFGCPHFYIQFMSKATGKINRWPLPCPWAWWWADSSDGNSKQLTYTNISGLTSPSDGHETDPVILTPVGLLASMYMHSDAHTDIPEAGDRTWQFGQMCLWNDDGPHTIDCYSDIAPFGTATPLTDTAYADGMTTYSAAINQGNRTLVQHRSKSTTAADIVLWEFDHTYRKVRRKKLFDDDGGTIRNYPGPLFVMSDGRTVITQRGIQIQTAPETLNRTNCLYTAIIAPEAADWDDHSKWFSASGEPLDGSTGLTMGSIDLLNNASDLHISQQNLSFFNNLPLPVNSVGMDAIAINGWANIKGKFEGIAALALVCFEGADTSKIALGGDGTPEFRMVINSSIEITRWTYTPGSSPSLVYKDAVDIMPQLLTWITSNWPYDTQYETVEIARIYGSAIANNAMLIVVPDPDGVAIDHVNVDGYYHLMGHSLRGVVVSNLDAADTADIKVEFIPDPLYAIPTDKSLGEGLMAYAVDGTENSKLLLVNTAAGVSQTQGHPLRTLSILNTTNDLTPYLGLATGGTGLSNSLSLSL